MNRKLVTFVALVVTTAIVPTMSAFAQSREAEIRYENAQRRFDGELAIFKAEAERYERAKIAAVLPSVAVAPVPSPVVREVPRSTSEDSAREIENEQRIDASAPTLEERSEADNRPPL
jgi:hypothetical protein